MEKIIVTEVRLEGVACPTYWVGITSDGRQIAARYRFGWLSFRLGAAGDCSETAADLSHEVFALELGGPDDGCLSYGQLKKATEEFVVWPEVEG
jgi:hypothetical protein